MGGEAMFIAAYKEYLANTRTIVLPAHVLQSRHNAIISGLVGWPVLQAEAPASRANAPVNPVTKS